MFLLCSRSRSWGASCWHITKVSVGRICSLRATRNVRVPMSSVSKLHELPGRPAGPSAESRTTGRCTWRGASTVRTHPRRHGNRARPADRARQCRIRLGPVRRRRNDAVCEQRHRPMAWIRVAARTPVGTDADYAAPNVIFANPVSSNGSTNDQLRKTDAADRLP
jgi:hypothetical protein